VVGIVAVLGRGIIPPDQPVLRADDRGVLHGDGLFETMHVRAGRPWLRDEHLTRLARSAAAVDLPLPGSAALADLLDTACAAWPADREGALRITCTRGPDGGDPVVYATIGAVPAAAMRGRRDGISIATLPLGVAATARADRPWLLPGIKSLSYATSAATGRWAARAGVDDVLWVSTDGYALEGPTANLVWLDGPVLCTVPPATTGILPGVTAGWLLAHADDLGLDADQRMIRPEELQRGGGAWLTSSVRGVAEIRSLDGVPLRPSRHTAAVRDLLGFPMV
jgi:4-amino-4-deoxychorismate lyase